MKKVKKKHHSFFRATLVNTRGFINGNNRPVAIVSIAIIFFAIISLFYPKFLETNGASQTIFTQSDWSGLSDSSAVANLPANSLNWNKFFEANNINTSNANQIKLNQINTKWQTDGVSLNTSPVTGDQQEPQITSDGSGGAIVTWIDNRNGNDNDIYAQRINSSGIPQWNIDGVAVATAAYEQDSPQITSDGSGGAIITWVDERSDTNDDIYAQRINSAGVVQWQINGVAISASADTGGDKDSPQITSDGSGGAIITWQDDRNGSNWDVYAQKINSSGVVQWTLDGAAISIGTGSQSSPQIVSDSSGNAIIIWVDNRNGNYNVYAQKINSAGVVQWATNGVAISTTAVQDEDNVQLVSDGSGGAIITWEDNRNGNDYDIYAQKINSAGVIQWTINGIAISAAANSQYYPQITSDGSGGAIITWYDYRSGNFNIYAQKINSTGDIQWMTDGLVISAIPNGYSPQITSDGSGGAIITWQDDRNGNDYDIYAQKINSAGVVQWTTDGVPVSTTTGNQIVPQITSDGSGGAIITWQDYRDNLYYNIYAQKVGSLAYANNGDLISSVIDTGQQTNWDKINWTNTTIPVNTSNASVSFQTRTAVDDPINNVVPAIGRYRNFIASSEDSPTDEASNIGDGDRDNTGWQSADDGNIISLSNPQWVAVDFGIPTKISATDLWYTPKAYPIDFDIQVCVDNSNCDESVDSDWNTILPVTDNHVANHLTSSFSQVVTKKIRIYITSADSPSYDMVLINELEAYSGNWSDWSNSYSNNDSITSLAGRFIQYKANLSSTDPDATAILTNISINSNDNSTESQITPLSSLVDGVPVSLGSGDLSVTPNSDFIDQMTGSNDLNLTMLKESNLPNFSVLNNVDTIANYLVSIGNSSMVDLIDPNTLTPFTIPITINYPSMNVSDVKICQDVNHDGSFDCPNAPDILYDASDLGGSVVSISSTSITFLVSSLSNFIVGQVQTASIPVPTYTPQTGNNQTNPTPVTEPVPATTLDQALAQIKNLQQQIDDLNKQISDLKDENAKLQAQQQSQSPQPVVSPPPASTNTYTVQPGDYLRSIAQNVYGDSNDYTKLIDLNKDQYPSLLTNPNDLFSGWQLKY